jgi:hypothetical protein
MRVKTGIISTVLRDAVSLRMILVRLIAPVTVMLEMTVRMRSLVVADAVVIMMIRSAVTALAAHIPAVGLRMRKRMKLVVTLIIVQGM